MFYENEQHETSNTSNDDLGAVMTPAEIEQRFELGIGTVRQAVNRDPDGEGVWYRRPDGRTILVSTEKAFARWAVMTLPKNVWRAIVSHFEVVSDDTTGRKSGVSYVRELDELIIPPYVKTVVIDDYAYVDTEPVSSPGSSRIPYQWSASAHRKYDGQGVYGCACGHPNCTGHKLSGRHGVAKTLKDAIYSAVIASFELA